MTLFSSARFYNGLLFLLILIAGIILWSNIAPSKKTTISHSNDYDAFATDVISTQFSTTGVKRYELKTPRLNHYKKNNQTYITTPRLSLYSSQQDQWLITSQYALATQGTSEISFIQDVDVSGADTKNHQKAQLLTEKMNYYPENSIAHTDLPVTILQPGSIIHSTGMNINFNSGSINLDSKINGSYDPNAS